VIRFKEIQLGGHAIEGDLNAIIFNPVAEVDAKFALITSHPFLNTHTYIIYTHTHRVKQPCGHENLYLCSNLTAVTSELDISSFILN
jgi:hypothetical protein